MIVPKEGQRLGTKALSNLDFLALHTRPQRTALIEHDRQHYMVETE